jgi:eukaryotic-like serine/threonine-protein kinase
VFDYGEAETADGAHPIPFLVMELVDGEPLSALLVREGRLGLEPTLDVVGPAALALGRRIVPGWCTATSSQPTCWSASMAW